MIEEQTMHKVMCDGCGRTSYQELAPSEELPSGLHGTALDTVTGTMADWYAHTARCIARSVTNSLARKGEQLRLEHKGGGRP